jgi:hypothetical protein
MALGRSSVLADQSADGVAALDPGSEVDDLAELTQRRPLLKCLMRPVSVIVPDVFIQDPPQVLLAGDQQVAQALAAQRSDESLGERVGRRCRLHPVQMIGTAGSG